MTNDKILRTLEFYQTLGKKIHIRIIGGQDAGLFRNGFIIYISAEKKLFVIKDNILGERPYLFEEIDENISEYKERGEWR